MKLGDGVIMVELGSDDVVLGPGVDRLCHDIEDDPPFLRSDKSVSLSQAERDRDSPREDTSARDTIERPLVKLGRIGGFLLADASFVPG